MSKNTYKNLEICVLSSATHTHTQLIGTPWKPSVRVSQRIGIDDLHSPSSSPIPVPQSFPQLCSRQPAAAFSSSLPQLPDQAGHFPQPSTITPSLCLHCQLLQALPENLPSTLTKEPGRESYFSLLCPNPTASPVLAPAL